ncbi:hypothetical protein TIFTF001_026446 [Ficus carica]|uniref:Uncharacterized protein n=1 Tax=Ficus carica TaxID=3494 RepID=A0AA88DL92_FICCA|nr:hypothetical protein TIFTF001_026446 [Ficus carica]
MKGRGWRPYGRRSNEEEGRAGGVTGRIRERCPKDPSNVTLSTRNGVLTQAIDYDDADVPT